MTLGDSMTAGYKGEDIGGYRGPLYNALVAQGYAPQMVGSVNCGATPLLPLSQQNCDGAGGNTIGQTTARVNQGIVRANNPDVVLLLVGFNSLYYTTDPVSADLRHLAETIDAIYAQKPTVRVIVASLIASTQCCSTGLITQYNAGIPSIVATKAAQGFPVTFVDMYPVVPSSELADYVHPTSEGYRRMAAAWLRAINAAASGR
jgi:lysophospholipase L1-like esterase